MPKIILFSIGVLFHFMASSQSSSVVIDTLWWDRMGYGGDEVLERMVVAEDNTLWCIGTTSSSEGYGQDVYCSIWTRRISVWEVLVLAAMELTWVWI